MAPVAPPVGTPAPAPSPPPAPPATASRDVRRFRMRARGRKAPWARPRGQRGNRRLRGGKLRGPAWRHRADLPGGEPGRGARDARYRVEPAVGPPNLAALPATGSDEGDAATRGVAARARGWRTFRPAIRRDGPIPRGDLRGSLVEGSPLPSERVLRLFAPVCDALDLAHDNGLVHQSLSGTSLLVEGDAALLDGFGVAGGPREPGPRVGWEFTRCATARPRSS